MSASNSSKLISDIVAYTPLSTNDLEQTREIRKRNLTGPNIPMVSDDVHVGIEVEVENCVATSQSKSSIARAPFGHFWTVTEDNSLRNNGLEYISKPISGNKIPVALSMLHQYLHDEFPAHQFTSRTSVHVHLNCRHMPQESFFNFILLYLVTEPVFYYFADLHGAARSQNNFCVPIEDSKFTLGLPQIISLFQRGDAKMALKTIFSNWRKYNGLNFLPLKSLGTVEFRHLSGTINVEFLVKWINMILSLRKYSCETSIEDARKQIFQLNTISSYSVFIESVLGITDVPEEILRTKLEDSSATVKLMFAYLENYKKLLSVGDDFEGSSLYNQLNTTSAVVDFYELKRQRLEFSTKLRKLEDTKPPREDETKYHKYWRLVKLTQNKIDRLDQLQSSVIFWKRPSTPF